MNLRAARRLRYISTAEGLPVAGRVVGHVADVDVSAVAERNEMREADAARSWPSRASRWPARRLRHEASRPARACVCAKLALRWACGTGRPKRLGPSTRSRCGRAASSMACCNVRPSAACWPLRPAVSTIAARVPLRPSASTSAGTVGAGVHTTAKSGAAGSDATSANAGRPATSERRRFTGHTGPAKPAASRLRITSAPMLRSRSDAPITAIERG